jgi:hypothetical protein
MRNESIKIKLNVEKLDLLYKAIQDNNVLTSRKNALLLNKPASDTNYYHNASNRSYTATRRLIDTATHLNSMEFGKCKHGTIAFDFYEFLLCADVIIRSIETLTIVYNLHSEVETLKGGSRFFSECNKPGATDDRFFSYIRSLCAVHPCETDHYAGQYHGKKEFHCCPYVTWDFDRQRSTLSVSILTPDQDKDHHLRLDFLTFVGYLESWIELTEQITAAVHGYVGSSCEEYRQKHIPSPSECTSYTAYFENLIHESNLRVDNGAEWVLRDFIDALQLTPSNAENEPALNRYLNAIRLAVEYYHKRLQKMNDTDPQYTGINCPEAHVETELIWEVHSPSYPGSNALSTGRSYAFEKLSYLDGKHDQIDEAYARMLLGKQSEWINQYVLFSNDEPNKETVILISIAEYLDALEHDSILNRNIPNELDYRRTLKEGSI